MRLIFKKKFIQIIEKGIFNKVKGEEFKNIQEIFEKIIKVV
jgi:hypothetical protein